jgi:hypothetical protein
LHNFNSVFTAEFCAFFPSSSVHPAQPRQYHLICTDSLSALQGLNFYSPDHPIVIEILIQLSYHHKSGKSVLFCPVTGHTGLPGNEAADAAAKAAALHGNLVSDRALGSDVRTFLHRDVLSS